MSSLRPHDDRSKDCPVQGVVPTGTIFAAALEHLNRDSTVTLLKELVSELDKHCQLLLQQAAATGKSAGAPSPLPAELLSLLPLLHKTAEQSHDQVALLKQRLTELSEKNVEISTEFVNAVIAKLEKKLAAANQETKEGTARRGFLALAIVIIALLFCGLGFLAGYLLGRGRPAGATCPPCPAGAGAPAGMAVPAIPACLKPCPPDQTGQAGQAGQTGQAGQAGQAGQTGRTVETAQTAQTARAPAVPPSRDHGHNFVCLSRLPLRPGSMEAELEEFLSSPAAAAPNSQGTPRSFVMDRLHYPPNSHDMNEEGKEEVYFLAQVLRAHPTAEIEIRGHDDGTEAEAYSGPNPYRGYTLSKLRADCVLRRLEGFSIAPERMHITGVAAAEPLKDADEHTEIGRQKNRRVEIVVLRR